MGLPLYASKIQAELPSKQVLGTETVSTGPGLLTPENVDKSCLYRPCCAHSACQSLREQSWCRHWIYLEWLSETYLSLRLVTSKLSEHLADSHPGFWGAWFRNDHDCFVYRLFVKADLDGDGFTHSHLQSLEELATAADLFDDHGTHMGFAVAFMCCAVYHREILSGYIADMLTLDKAEVGDRRIYLHLQQHLRGL